MNGKLDYFIAKKRFFEIGSKNGILELEEYFTKQGKIAKGLSPVINFIIGLIVNIVRSIPFIILLIAIIPFTRWLVGTSIGTNV